jgi:hypothetical protein
VVTHLAIATYQPAKDAMTKPTPPTARTGDPQLARDVAKHLDRRRLRRKLVGWTAILALGVVAAMYLTCGRGFGLGGLGTGTGEGPGSSRTLVAPRRCTIRITARGIAVDGKPVPRDEAVAACQDTPGADVIITGDAREGDWKELRGALEAAGIKDIAVHQPTPAGAGSGAGSGAK